VTEHATVTAVAISRAAGDRACSRDGCRTGRLPGLTPCAFECSRRLRSPLTQAGCARGSGSRRAPARPEEPGGCAGVTAHSLWGERTPPQPAAPRRETTPELAVPRETYPYLLYHEDFTHPCCTTRVLLTLLHHRRVLLTLLHHEGPSHIAAPRETYSFLLHHERPT
jgi:hypothetical protein